MKPGWEIKKLGEVLGTLRNGVNCKQNKKGLGDKISRIESISKSIFDTEKVGYAELSKSDKEKYRLKKGDILFSHINSPIHVGKTALFNSDEEVFHGVNLLLLRPKPLLDATYFEHYLKFLFQNGYWKGLCKQSVNQASVNQQDINKVTIHFPKSLHEQQRIVAILDETFESITKAKVNTEQNLRNVKKIFDSYFKSVFNKKGDGWAEERLEECFKLKSGDGLTSKMMSEGGSYPVFGGNGIAGLHNTYNLSGSNVIIGRVGALCGNVRHLTENVWLTDNAFMVVDFKYDFDLSFLTYLLNFKNLRSFARQTAQPVISNSSLKDVLLEFPKDISVQQAIVQKLDALSAETKNLETNYQTKIETLEVLKKSLLQKAFNGEFKTIKDVAV